MRANCIIMLFVFFFPMAQLQAGDWERLLFLEGKRLSRSELREEILDDLEFRYSRVTKACTQNPEKICIPWKLSLASPLQENEARLIVEDAIAVWIQGAGLPIEFEYMGLSETNELPYKRDQSGEIILDEFNNPILEGEFLFSFNPPTEDEGIQFEEQELSKSKKYVLYSESENVLSIEWGGVFVNPVYNPFGTCSSKCLGTSGFLSYTLRSVLVFEVGRLLGLGPSGLAQSVMYPVQVPQAQKRFDFLREDDRTWIRKLYGLSLANSGSLSGRVIDGRTGKPWSGANVLVLPLDDLSSFSETMSLNLLVHNAISKSNGEFFIPAIQEGTYILMMESMNGEALIPEIFDDWTFAFGRREYFEPEYYDGKGRESNLEMLRYSPRGAWFAAMVHVIPGEETTGIEFITNVFDENVERIEASGSNHETLSPFVAQDVTDRVKEQQSKEWDSSSSSGCHFNLDSKPLSISFWGVLIAMLVLLYRSRKLLS